MNATFDRTRWVIAFGCFALLLSATVLVMRPFFVPLGWAIILALVCWPLYRRIRGWMPKRPGLAAFLMTTLLAAILVALIVPLTTALSSEIGTLSNTINKWFARSEHIELPEFVRRIPVIGENIQTMLDSNPQRRELLTGLVKEWEPELLAITATVARGVMSNVAKFLLCLLTLFFFFRDGAALAEQLRTALRRVGGANFDRILSAIRDTLRGGALGALATAIAQGVLAAIGFATAGAPAPLLLGCATAICSLLPFGASIIYLPVLFVLWGQGASVMTLVLLAAWCLGVVSTADNLLRALFIGQTTRMPLLLIFFGLLGGAASFGLIGIFIGPAIMAVLQVVWNEWIGSVSSTKAS